MKHLYSKKVKFLSVTEDSSANTAKQQSIGELGHVFQKCCIYSAKGIKHMRDLQQVHRVVTLLISSLGAF